MPKITICPLIREGVVVRDEETLQVMKEYMANAISIAAAHQLFVFPTVDKKATEERQNGDK